MKKPRPLVSVVIPAYNCEKYIADAIESVMKQTYTKLELIIINDCSPDHCENVILKYMAVDNRIRYVKNDRNLGVAASRNRGVRLSMGDYVAFLDSDDIWLRNKIEKQINCVEAGNGYFCYTSYSLVDESNSRKLHDYIAPESIDYKRLLYRNVIGCSTVLIKRSILMDHPMEHDSAHEDYINWLTILKRYGKANGVTESLVLYRVVKNSKCSNKIKSLKMTDRVYKLEGLKLFQRMFYLSFYSVNGIKKHFLHVR